MWASSSLFISVHATFTSFARVKQTNSLLSRELWLLFSWAEPPEADEDPECSVHCKFGYSQISPLPYTLGFLLVFKYNNSFKTYCFKVFIMAFWNGRSDFAQKKTSPRFRKGNPVSKFFFNSIQASTHTIEHFVSLSLEGGYRCSIQLLYIICNKCSIHILTRFCLYDSNLYWALNIVKQVPS